MATLAVFIALGGTGYAAFSLPRDSVGARELRNRSVSSKELRSNSVTSSKVRNGALTEQDLSPSARASLRGAAGERGPTGPRGLTGATGPAGPAGVTLTAQVDARGRLFAGSATSAVEQGAGGDYKVRFARSVAGCTYAATIARVPVGPPEDPPPAEITVAADGDDVRVRTYDASGNSDSFGFHLIVAC
jgi:hypothetical protein